MRVLVVNAGSRTVKLSAVGDADDLVASRVLGPPDEGTATELGRFVTDVGRVDVVGHRVVHGGSRFTAPVVVDESVRRELEAVSDLAPLHNPPALAGIDAARRLLPGTPSVACFDTAFHAGMAPEAFSYAIPAEWVTRWGIRRYGFHGLSCDWSVTRASALLNNEGQPRPVPLRVVVCHLGGGASVTAVSGGRSVDTTMGFTPLEGLIMATRSGDVDPGALLWALQRGLGPDQASHDLEWASGILALSGGFSEDMRALLDARETGHQGAALAVAAYVHRLRAKIAAMAAATAGTDALVFTAGVGENSPPIRAETCRGLGWMGVELDEAANATAGEQDADLSAPGAPVRTLVIHAREELEIAAQCRRVLEADPEFQTR